MLVKLSKESHPDLEIVTISSWGWRRGCRYLLLGSTPKDEGQSVRGVIGEAEIGWGWDR